MTRARSLRETFWRDGYISVPDLLDGDDLAELRSLYDAAIECGLGPPTGPPGVLNVKHLTRLVPALLETAAYRSLVVLASDLLGARVALRFDHGIVKLPGASEIRCHQDGRYSVAEAHAPAAHLWVALDDTDEPSGCLRFVPGSHRGPLLPHVETRGLGEETFFVSAGDTDDMTAVTCAIRAGGVTAHTTLTVHGSEANRATTSRRGWILQFLPVARGRRRRFRRLRRPRAR